MPVSLVGARAAVRHWTISVHVECLQCGAHHEVTLIASSEAPTLAGSCPGCSATFELGGVQWTPGSLPQFAIASTPSTRSLVLN